MKYFKLLFKGIKEHLVLFISIFLVATLIPFFITSTLVKPNIDTYEVNFKAENIDVDNLISLESISNTKQIIIDIRNEEIAAGNKAPYSDFSYVDESGLAKGGMELEELQASYTLSCKTKYFNSEAQARRFMTTMILNPEYGGNENAIFNDPICITNELNSFVVLGYSALFGIVVTLITFSILTICLKDGLTDELVYDNKRIYRLPFHISYFKQASSELKTVRKLVLLAILFALQLVVGLITIPSGFANLGIGLSFVIFALIGMLYGPIVGLTIGFFSDILGFIIQPNGVFFFGYVLSAMLSGFVYGMCFYRTKVTFTKCLLSRLIVNIIINVILGSIWWWIISDRSFSLTDYMLFISLPKNLIYLLPQTVILFAFFKVLSRILLRTNLVDKQICENITFI